MTPFDLTNLIFGPLISLFLYINAGLIIIIMVFIKPRRVTSIYLWIAAFLLLPLIFVLIFYILFGRDYHRQKMFKNKWMKDADVVKLLREQRKNLVLTSESYVKSLHENVELARMLINTNNSFVTMDNEVRYINEGDEFFEALFEEISKAKRFIHVEMYIIRNDELGKKLAHELAVKAKEGVEVKLLFDAVGCHKLPRKFFRELREAGGKTAEYFPSWIRGINTRINNRNHRKMYIVDGETGICSGFNRRHRVHRPRAVRSLAGRCRDYAGRSGHYARGSFHTGLELRVQGQHRDHSLSAGGGWPGQEPGANRLRGAGHGAQPDQAALCEDDFLGHEEDLYPDALLRARRPHPRRPGDGGAVGGGGPPHDP